MSENRPPHLIHPDEVAEWLANSAVRVVTYHRTTVYGARSIIEHGVDIARSQTGAYGQGFYTSTAPLDEDLFDATIVVAVRLERPLSGMLDDVAAQVDALIVERFGGLRPITPPVAAAIRRSLIGLGYDGLIIFDAGGDDIDYVVALFGPSVKVVQP